MILIDKYKCGYQIVPKSGSQSVCEYFANLLNIQADEKYKTGGYKFRRELDQGRGTIEGYYTFSFVRNPWTRLVSGYYEFLKYVKGSRKGNPHHSRQEKKWIRQGKLTISQMLELMSSKEDLPTFDAFADFVINIEEQHGDPNGHWLSQCRTLRSFYLTNKKRKICISNYDFIGRLESFEKDLKHVAGVIGTPIDYVPWTHKQVAGSGKTYKEFYTNQKMIDGVGKYYEEDIDRFKYTF